MWYRWGIGRAAEGSGWVEGWRMVSRRGRSGQGRFRVRSNGNKPCLSMCGVRGGAGGATTEVGGENCAPEARPEGAREVVSRVLQGQTRACEGDQGRVRNALGRRYAHATGARAYCALLKVVDKNVDAIAGVAGQ